MRRGLGQQLYDDATQFRVQREFSPEVAIRAGALPYNHPPFEAALFVPFTLVPYPLAFALWDLVNFVMLIALPFFLAAHLSQLQKYPWPLWVLASVAFFPIFAALLQGQDSILLLLLYALAFVCLKGNRDVLAGGWLALGLFKPQLLLPLVVLFLVQGRKKILSGFLPIAAILLLVSVAIVGKEGMLLYPHYVMHLENTLARGAIVPSDMPNLRGALAIFFPGTPPHIVAVILVISLGLLLFTASECRKVFGKNLVELEFSLAAIATVLVSYHALIYDLSVLMVPVLLLADELLAGKRWGRHRVLMMVAMTTFFLPPLQVILSIRNQWAGILGWVLLLWLYGIAKEISFLTTSRGQPSEMRESV
ncbi:MAG TPA: glycosyltransferase family 87 protein [Terriglobales bacterium]|nr:glycosyltransferase family 87 protein [Terriglobales bacterium]